MVHVVAAAPGAISAGEITPVVALIEQVSGVEVAKVTAPVPEPPDVVTTSVMLVSAMVVNAALATRAD